MTEVALTVQFKLPDLGEGVAETEIVRWLVQPGDSVDEDQPMVEVMTDKATVEIPSPASGVVTAVHAQEGDVVPVGTVIVEIGTAEAAGSAAAATATPPQRTAEAAPPVAGKPTVAASRAPQVPSAAAAARVQATPLVRKLAQQLGVDLATVRGTGAKGRIVEADVRAAAGNASGAQTASPASTPARADEGVRERRTLRGMRRMIADHLTQAQRVPVVTVVEECDLTALEQERASSLLGYLPYVLKAAVRGFEVVPELNATLDEQANELVLHDRVDMGIAVQTDDGLVVPVLRDCSQMSLEQIEASVTALADAAKGGRCTPDQLRGGTFTITSAGKFGGLFTTPLLNVPQVGILGLHRAGDRAVVVDGEVAVRRMANLSVTFDHRAVDGIDASRFLLAAIEALQTPQRL